jgi:hypothetical protein
MRHLLCASVVVGYFSLFCAQVSGADWVEPKDGKFTEKQLQSFIAAQKEYLQYMKAVSKAAEGTKTGLGAVALGAGINEKLNAILAKNGLQQEEYFWISNKAMEAFGLATLDTMAEKTVTDQAEMLKKLNGDTDAAKAKLTAFEGALKSGTRVLTAERREELVKQIKEQQQAALDEAKTHTDEAKAAADEAAKAEADAKASDALAQKPPADVEPDSKADYVKGKKEEADNFRNSAKDVREREKEARKLEAESKAKAAGFAQQALRPEVPATPDEKEQVKTENEQGVTNTKAELQLLNQTLGVMAEQSAAVKKQMAETHKNTAVNEENLALVKKHSKEILQAITGEEKN